MTTRISTRPYALPARRLRRFGGIWSVLRQMMALYRQRSDLGRLDAHLLEDIGVSETAARTEARRAPWDVPGHWRC